MADFPLPSPLNPIQSHKSEGNGDLNPIKPPLNPIKSPLNPHYLNPH
jgi:hypothetical protein